MIHNEAAGARGMVTHTWQPIGVACTCSAGSGHLGSPQGMPESIQEHPPLQLPSARVNVYTVHSHSKLGYLCDFLT